MKREAMIVYLRDVRDLEVAKYRLNALIEQKGREYQNTMTRIKNEGRLRELPSKPSTAGVGTAILLVLALVLAVILTGLSISLIGSILTFSDLEVFIDIFALVMIGPLALGAWGLVLGCGGDLLEGRDKRKDYQSKLAAAEAYNRKVEAGETARDERAQRARSQCAKAQRAWRRDLEQVQALLDKYYALNILPNQYRKLSCVCYIYDYMSSSQATLEDTLMHEHMENGFQRLERKLDQVIAAVETQIYETRCLRAENREQAQRLAAQDQLQLKLLERTERDAAEAARYAGLIECNTRATALFSAADYLRR